MNPAAANILAESFLDGFFEVFGTTLSTNFERTSGTAAIADETTLRTQLEACPVQLVAIVQEGLGQVALLFSEADALGFLATMSGAPAGDEIGAGEKDALREMAEAALAGGVWGLLAKIEHGAVDLDGVKVEVGANVSALAATMGGGAFSVSFTFESGDGRTGTGYVLFSEEMMGLVPAGMHATAAPGTLAQPSLSPDELNDILGGFPAGEAEAAPVAPLGAGGERRPASLLHGSENLDLVLDIRLLATARLGRVEMPLGEILNLGPGSILEVGHLVDEPIELLINDKLIARGDVVVVDEKFGLRITEIVSQRERIESLR